MDLSKLSRSDQIIAGSGIVLLIAAFLPWFSVDVGFASASANAFEFFLVGTVPTILGVIMATQVILSRLTDVKLPETKIPMGRLHMILGIVVAALIWLKLLIGEDIGAGLDADRSIGIFLAALASLGLVAGGVLANREAPQTGGATPPHPPPA